MKKLGKVLMILGAAALLGALGLTVWNRLESKRAGEAAAKTMQVMHEMISARRTLDVPALTPDEETPDAKTQHESVSRPAEAPAQEDAPAEEAPQEEALPVVEIDGHGYIGYLTFPSLELELPVMADWSYQDLKLSPCRFCGAPETDDLVIAGHNYSSHFGPLSRLAVGDTLTFTDMNGHVTAYRVAGRETLRAGEVEKMTSSGYALTLFTCTYGGTARMAVRCVKEA